MDAELNREDQGDLDNAQRYPQPQDQAKGFWTAIIFDCSGEVTLARRNNGRGTRCVHQFGLAIAVCMR